MFERRKRKGCGARSLQTAEYASYVASLHDVSLLGEYDTVRREVSLSRMALRGTPVPYRGKSIDPREVGYYRALLGSAQEKLRGVKKEMGKRGLL